MKFLTEAGFNVVAKEQISPGSVDVTAQALRIKAANPSVVLVTGASVADLYNYIKAHALLGIKAPMIGNNLFAVTTFPPLAGKAADGFMFVDAVDMARPDVKAVESKLMARYADRAKGSTQMIAAYDMVIWWSMPSSVPARPTAPNCAMRWRRPPTGRASWGALGHRVFSPTNHDGIDSEAQVVIRLVKDGQFAGSVD